MRSLKEFKIPYTGLSLGKHDFQFEVNDKFFAFFDYEDLKDSKVDLTVELDKQSSMIQLFFSFKGVATVACDRCGDDMQINLKGEERLIVKYGETSYIDQTDDILVISPAEHEIDIAQFVYEYIHVALPVSHSHKDSKDCNQEVIKKLNELSQHNETEETDPRWAALKNIKNE